jgi:hypothetical protein
MKTISLFFFLCLLACGNAFADNTEQPSGKLTAEQIQEIDDLNNLRDKIDELKNLSKSITRQKYSDCLMAFGDNQFCNCLAENLPVTVDFKLYIYLLTTPKHEIDYDNLDQKDKDVVDTTLSVREKCVGK